MKSVSLAWPKDTVFLQSYSRQQPHLKSGVSLLLAPIIAEYPFIVEGLSLAIRLEFWQKRKKNGASTPYLDDTEIYQIVVKDVVKHISSDPKQKTEFAYGDDLEGAHSF